MMMMIKIMIIVMMMMMIIIILIIITVMMIIIIITTTTIYILREKYDMKCDWHTPFNSGLPQMTKCMLGHDNNLNSKPNNRKTCVKITVVYIL